VVRQEWPRVPTGPDMAWGGVVLAGGVGGSGAGYVAIGSGGVLGHDSDILTAATAKPIGLAGVALAEQPWLVAERGA
jgi:hypothetical protein